MLATLLLMATWILGTLGFAMLALSQKQHWSELRGNRSDQPPAWLPLAGWPLLGLAMVPAIWRDGVGFGLICWCMLLPLSAFTVVLLLSRLNIDRGSDTGI